jgi:murein DD-endopeptidase MepM/ murein hydrolase activator NlpD
MTRRDARLTVPVAALFVAFCAGALVTWALYSYGPPRPAIHSEVPLRPETIEPEPKVRLKPDTTNSGAAASGSGRAFDQPVATMGAARSLRVPIDGSDVESWKGGFVERRGNRPHDAVDILAPRNTPVHAVTDGTIAKLFVSKAGGNTIYQFDPSGQLAYYYAHLERYADGLHDGQAVSQGDVIGYVGTSGNAPPGTPHLHFAVFKLNEDRHWWRGEALDPYNVFHK